MKIYTTPTCRYCELAKLFCEDNNIPYTLIDVQADLEARKEMIQISDQMGVPVLDLGEDGFEVQVGFDLEKLCDYYKIDKE